MDMTQNPQAPAAGMNPQGQLDPEMIKHVLALQNNAEDPNAIALQRKQAMVNQMRQSAMTPEEGQMVGKRYVAPSALSSLVRVGQGAMAGYQQGQVDQGMKGLGEARTNSKADYMKALTAGLRRGPSPGNTEVGATPLNPMSQGQNILVPGSTPQAGY